MDFHWRLRRNRCLDFGMQCADATRLAAGYYTALGHGALDAFAADVTMVLENFKAATKRSGLEVRVVIIFTI